MSHAQDIKDGLNTGEGRNIRRNIFTKVSVFWYKQNRLDKSGNNQKVSEKN